MDFSWSADQGQLYERVLSFAREQLNSGALERDREHRFGADEWRRCAGFGLTGLCAPTAYGGLGLDSLSTAHALEALGRGCEDGGLAFSLAAHLFACVMPLAEHGAADVKQRLLPGLCSGAIGANAITEPEAGSDVAALKCRAERDGGDYLLTGDKSFVTNAPVADVFVVYASTNPAHGYLGVSAFVVERNRPGLTIGKPFDKIGLNTSPISSLYLDGCRVPAGNRLGEEGQGALVFRTSMHWERVCLFAAYLGIMDRQLESTIRYASERRQGGHAIGKYQAVSHRIADMKLRLEAARLLAYRACWLRDTGQDATLAIAMAKLAVSEAAVASGIDAIQIHGGNGVIRELGVERWLRDAIPSTIFSGTSEIQRNLIASSLGL